MNLPFVWSNSFFNSGFKERGDLCYYALLCYWTNYSFKLNLLSNLKNRWNMNDVCALKLESATVSVLENKLLLKIPQNSRENNLAKFSFLIKLWAEAYKFFKKRLLHRCFPVNFAKFWRSFLQNTSGWLLL